jgi:hypothetical protein
MMTTLKPHTNAAALKGERDRDKAQATRDYEEEARARHANMMRLRAMRLARESAIAQTTPAPPPMKKKAVIQRSSPTRARAARRVAS